MTGSPDGACATLDFESHGAVIRVSSAVGDALELVRAALPPGSRPASGTTPDVVYHWRRRAGSAAPSELHVVTVQCPIETDADDVACEHDAADAADLLSRDAEFRVALHARRGIFVHAGALGWKGRAILVPGYTHMGKSTLTAALVAAGATYYSDEYAVLDDAGCLHPFARPMRLRHQGRKASRHTAAELGGTAGTEPLPVGLIVSTRFEAGAVWEPRRVSAGKAALALLDNTVVTRFRPAEAMAATGAAAARAVAVEGPRGEAAETARRILRLADELFGQGGG
ncbi:MAG TPA: hypothetical protein VGE02_05645 [Gemmatimonadales bacterium]